MKIEFIKLVNFANIKTSFKSKEISIDFTKCKNKIVLLTGPNGSGKTSILSCLHPFARNGNLDVRSDNSLIIIGKEGYKEIIIDDDGNKYLIKHFYTPSKESHTVKSYIERNGMELNPNGNVSSFEKIIKEEFDIEPDYLKLTRLGSNVTNFIDLKTTERKSFMGKILDEVEIYLKYHKKLTSDMRELKSIISHLVDKITKLSITDEDELNKTQKHLKKEIDKYKEEIDSVNASLSIINYEIEKYDSPLFIKESLDIKRKELDKIHKVLNKQTDIDLSLKECEKLLSEKDKDFIALTSNMESLKEKRDSMLNSLDKLLLEESDINKELKKIEDSSEIKDVEYMIKEIKDRISNRNKETHIVNYEPKFSKKELEDLINMLDKNMDILYTTYEFGKEPIKKAIKYISSNLDISDYVSSHNEKIQKNKLQAASEYVYKELTKKFGIVKPNCKDSNFCNIKRLYDELFDLATEKPDTVIEDETFVTYTKLSNQNINTVLKNIQKSKDIIEKMPDNIKNMFVLKDVLNKISNLESIYDKNILYNELSLITEYELQQQDLNELSSLKEKLFLLKKSIGNSDYFSNKKESLKEEISKYKSDIDIVCDDIYNINLKITDTKNEILVLKELKESIEKKDIVTEEYNVLNDSFHKVKELYETKKEKTNQLDTLMFSYNKLMKEYNDNDYRLKSYESMTEELNRYNTTYDEMELVKNSLSSKEGIPLLFIEVYLKNIQEITNELLEIIYDGELYIEKFNITADEFKIPYVKNGTQIKDVCYASQGERSFISLALSFALTYQSISRYNIMLLDEIDSTLDTKNREKFLQILQKQMSMIEAEQTFVISHNNMFNMYPVDIIDTKNKTNEDNKLANYIKIKAA